jgi:hypothetical protein
VTAFPTRAYLRRHALPANVLANLDIGRPLVVPSVRQPPPVPPRLVATWRVDAQGRLVCRWSLEHGFFVSSG